jgi:hypothetical protein
MQSRSGLNPMKKIFEELALSRNFEPKKHFTPAQLILALAGEDLSRNFTVSRFEEEPITAALSGALSAHSAWVLPLAELGEKGSRVLCWGHHRKSGSNSIEADRAPSESQTGADFSLLVRFDEDHALLAVFQCKSRLVGTASDEPDSTGYLSFRLSSKSGEARFRQIDNLIAHGNELVGKMKPFRPNDSVPKDVSGLDWIHYMVYREGEPSCVSLSKLSPLIAARRPDASEKRRVDDKRNNTSEPGGTIHLTKQDIREFGKLIDFSDADTTIKPPHMKGWLTLKLNEIEQVIPKLYDFSELYVVDEKNGPFPSINLGVSNDVKTITFRPNARLSEFLSARFSNSAPTPAEAVVVASAIPRRNLAEALGATSKTNSRRPLSSPLGQVLKATDDSGGVKGSGAAKARRRRAHDDQ